MAMTCALLLPVSALAAPPVAGQGRAPARVEPASTCSALFGDRQSRARSAARRAALLDWVDEDESGVTVAHTSNRWDEPVRLRLDGMRVQAIDRRSGTVTVVLAPRLAKSVGCQPGRYELRTDDRLAAGTRILAVLKGGLLLEHRGELGYVGRRSPRWLMAWRMEGVEMPFVRNPRPHRFRKVVY